MEDLVLDILDELRRSSELDAKALAALVRKHNDARSDVSTHLAKKHIHPFYLRVKSKDSVFGYGCQYSQLGLPALTTDRKSVV